MKLNFVRQDQLLKMKTPGRLYFPFQNPELPKKAITQRDPSPQLYLDAVDTMNAARQHNNPTLYKTKLNFYNTKLYFNELSILSYLVQKVDSNQIDVQKKTFWMEFDERFAFYFTFDNIRQSHPQLISSVKAGSPYQVKIYMDFNLVQDVEWELL